MTAPKNLQLTGKCHNVIEMLTPLQYIRTEHCPIPTGLHFPVYIQS